MSAAAARGADGAAACFGVLVFWCTVQSRDSRACARHGRGDAPAGRGALPGRLARAARPMLPMPAPFTALTRARRFTWWR